MAVNNGKIAIIGAGRIGSLCAWSLAMGGIGREIVLVDIDQPKLHAQATDLCDASMHLSHSVKIISGGYADCADAEVALICVGVRPQGACPRSGHLAQTAAILAGIAENLSRSSFSGVTVLASYPNDILSRYFQQVSGYPVHKVIGAEAMVYSLRLRRLLGERFQVEQAEIEAYAIGECGESQAVAWSAAQVAGKPLLDLMEEYPDTYGRIDLSDVANKSRHMGWVIQDGKGREEFGITSAACIVTQAILEDSHSVLPVSVSLEGAYGQQDIYASTPAVIGRDGVERVVELPLNAGEQAEFNISCVALRELYSQVSVYSRQK